MDNAIPLIVVIVIALALSIGLSLLLSSDFQRYLPYGGSQLSFQCPQGECATDLLTGQKTCPESPSDRMTINLSQQHCNPANSCAGISPYALHSDGSALTANCEQGANCPCLREQQCPNYILSVFNVQGGNIYTEDVDSQKITFPQTTSYIASQGGVVNTPPIKIANSAATLCTIPMVWLTKSVPGCSFLPEILTVEDLEACMGMQSGCSGFSGSPCSQGVLALISNSNSTIQANNLENLPFGCVAGVPCDCGQIAVYDTGLGNVVCKKISQFKN